MVRQGNTSQVAEAAWERQDIEGVGVVGGDRVGGSDWGGASRALAQDNRPKEVVVGDGNWVWVKRGTRGGAAHTTYWWLERG